MHAMAISLEFPLLDSGIPRNAMMYEYEHYINVREARLPHASVAVWPVRRATRRR